VSWLPRGPRGLRVYWAVVGGAVVVVAVAPRERPGARWVRVG
jgi:hypothetical protein